jgi:sugar phosphate permease
MNKNRFKSLSLLFFIGVFTLGLQACTVVKVVDAAASTTVGVAKGTAKVGGKVAGAAIPDGDKKEEK